MKAIRNFFMVISVLFILSVVLSASDPSYRWDNSQRFMFVFMAAMGLAVLCVSIYSWAYNSGLSDKDKEWDMYVPNAREEFNRKREEKLKELALQDFIKKMNKRPSPWK